MPEGDTTILRAARTLHKALAGKRVTEFESALPALLRVDDQSPLRGRRIERVTATGKHLINEFSDQLFLRTHMRMNGSWHLYRAGERWRKRRSDMRIVIGAGDFVAVGFNIPVAEFHQGEPDLRHLGPDVLSDDFDATEVLRRTRSNPDAEIANVLLDQRVIAGAGNIYKSEALFERERNVLVSEVSARLESRAMLIKGMTEQEIRVLQEFRRIQSDSMTLAAIKAIKHPTGGGEAPALSLVAKGYLTAGEDGQTFSLTQKAKEFLAYDPKPEFEEVGAATAEEPAE